MTAIIVTCLAYILRRLQRQHSYPPQLSTGSEGGSWKRSETFLSAIKHGSSLQRENKFSFPLPQILVRGIDIISPYCIQYHQECGFI